MPNPTPVHRNITRFRSQRGLTLTSLAERSGIAKSTLSQLESGVGNPTVDTLWAIASALGVSFSQLVDDEAAGSTDLLSDGSIVRFIEKSTTDPEIEVYSMVLKPNCRMDSAPHPVGVRERVTVLSGSVYVGPVDRPRLLHAGDADLFTADVPHFYAAKELGARLHVVVEYPSRLFASSSRTGYLHWPTTPSEWDGVQAVIDRMLTEVSNGLDARILRFQGTPTGSGRAKTELISKIANRHREDFLWPLFFTVETDEQGLYFAVIGLHWARTFKGGYCGLPPEITRLATLAESPGQYLDENQMAAISSLATTPSWVTSTLAAEALLQRGKVVMPFYGNQDGAFELLRPACARQVVAVAQEIHGFSAEVSASLGITNVLNVGGMGSTVPLLMLREILPSVEWTELTDMKSVHADQSVAAITSVSASHHFNTVLMLQKAMRLLRPEGLLVIADEFLPSYTTQDERNCALVLHHSAYLLHSMQGIDAGSIAGSDAERTIYRDFHRTLTLAWMTALDANGPQAIATCRGLYQRMQNTTLSKKNHGDLGAFIRFFWLELQAMIAGFDYEVEQKSHPKRFVEMAAFAGFEMLNHRRVFATQGSGEWDGGTHLFTFRKPAES